jgi:hypothetical protein
LPGFRELFWGFLFLFDFRLNGIDILPDVVGYFLLYNGLVKLEVYSSHFTSSCRLMILLTILSIPDIYAGWWYPESTFNFVYHLALIFLDLMAVYHLCSGVKQLAAARQRIDLVEKANNRWMLYMIIGLISAFGMLGFSVLMHAPLIIALFIFALVVLLLMMDLMKKCETQLS